MAKRKGKKKDDAPFALENADCVIVGMGMSFDMDGSDPVERRTLRLEGINRNQAQIDAHLGKYTHNSWFKVDAATRLASPMDWWEKRESRDFQTSEKFNVESLSIKCGSKILKFESEQHEDGDGETPAGKIKDIVYSPQVGGVALVSLKLSVRPDPDQAALLTEFFKRHVKVTLGEISAAEKDDPKQGELAVSDQGNGKPAEGEQAAGTH